MNRIFNLIQRRVYPVYILTKQGVFSDGVDQLLLELRLAFRGVA